MIRIEEKKDHLIVKHKDFKSLPKEKQDWLINYFKSRDNPPNMSIDWLKLNNYNIEDIYKATLEKTKTGLKKGVKKLGIGGLEEGKDYIELDISEYTNTYKAYIPLHWEASKLIASSKIGGCEGEWCVAYQKDISYWNSYTTPAFKGVFIYIVNTKKPEKYAILYFLKPSEKYEEFYVWDSKDKQIGTYIFEKLTGINIDIFKSYRSYIEKVYGIILVHKIKFFNKKYKEYIEGEKYVENIELLKEIVDTCPEPSSSIKKLKIGFDNLDDLFYDRNLEGYDISEWDVSKVTSMGGLFSKAKSIGDISKWNVSNVRNMKGMFSYSDFNGDISQWDVSNVEDMNYMFCGSEFNGDISKWNVSKVRRMSHMFELSNFKGDISQWDVSNVLNMSYMFSGSAFNGDISKWDVSKVVNMEGMFEKSEFNRDISNWDVSNVEIMGQMFYRSKFNGDISNWNVSNVVIMSNMFKESEFNGDISKWDVSNVNYMDGMFYGSKFSGDISNWNVSNVKNAILIFQNSPLQQRYPNGLKDLIKEQQRKKENVIKKFLYTSIWRDV